MQSVFKVSSVGEIDRKDIDRSLTENGFALIRGLFDLVELNSVVQKVENKFRHEDDAPTVGESPKDVQRNFQKLLVGGKTQSDDYLTRLFRVFYNPVWDEDIYEMRKHFKVLIHVRNYLMQVSSDFAFDSIDKSGLWSATRLHHFPCGGGFMSKHRDYIVDGHLKDRNLKFYQLLLNLNKKGESYQTGGAYVDWNGNRIDLDAIAEIGDVIVYDGRSLHGVEEVDPHKKLDLSSMDGRLVAFATLYDDKSDANNVSIHSDEVTYDSE